MALTLMSVYSILDAIGDIDAGAKAVCLGALAMDSTLREEVVNLSEANDIPAISEALHWSDILRQDDIHRLEDKLMPKGDK